MFNLFGKSNKKPIKIRFIKSPSGAFNLAYTVGEIATFEYNQAMELIDTGYAEKL